MSENKIGSIYIEGLSKSFKKGASRSSYTTLKTSLIKGKKEDHANPSKARIQTVLDNISLKLEPGSSTALIGRNGSGKSTLLKLISGIYIPDQGSVKVSGSLSALIELGAGFHPDFTGRENVFLGGVMFGLSKKEISERFDDIVSYAELWDVIDEPVRTYSSGMYMRLGFSLAIHTDPDILLVDEVLAVGDAHFISRCHDSISEFKRRGKTLVFVTHDLSSVSRWCDHAIWLDKGKIRSEGNPKDISNSYLEDIKDQENLESNSKAGNPFDYRGEKGRKGTAWGDGAVIISDVQILNKEFKEQKVFFESEEILVNFKYSIRGEVTDLVFGINISRTDGLEIFGTNSSFDETLQNKINLLLNEGEKDGEISFKIKRAGLVEDSYYIDIAAHASNGAPYDYHHQIYKIQIRNKIRAVGVSYPELEWQFKPLENSKKVEAC